MRLGRLLREAEVSSPTYRNTKHLLHVIVKHGLVILHMTYSKTRQQCASGRPVRGAPGPSQPPCARASCAKTGMRPLSKFPSTTSTPYVVQ